MERSTKLKYEFIVHPGADPSQIRLTYRGAKSVSINGQGKLEVATSLGTIQDDSTPVAYQMIDGKKVTISLAFKLEDHKVCSVNQEADLMTQEEGTGPDTYRPIAEPMIPTATGSMRPVSKVGEYDPGQALVIDPAMLVYCGYVGGLGSDSGSGYCG